MSISANKLAGLARVDRRVVVRAWRRGFIPGRSTDGWGDNQLPDLLAGLATYRADARRRRVANLRLRWKRPRRRHPLDEFSDEQLLAMAVASYVILPAPPPLIEILNYVWE